jgi:hypothetical protein
MPSGWRATQRRILARDGGRCRNCGGIATEVHHSQDGREDDNSLISLCHGCHASITAAKARAARLD